jgi:Zn finger protein HypA/HybF involved in hydrogenase expression
MRIACRDCEYTAEGDSFEDLENKVDEDGGYLDIDRVNGEIADFDCPECRSNDAEFDGEADE